MADGARSPRARAYASMAAAVAVGSWSFTLIEIVLRDLAPSSVAAGRVVFSALAFVTVIAAQPRRRRRIDPGDRVRLVLAGLGGSAGFHLLFSAGQERVTVGVSAVVLGTMPALVAVGEWVFLHRRPSPAQFAGLACSLLGIVVISSSAGNEGSSSVLGLVLVAAATAVWAGVTVVTRSLTDRYDPWWLNTPGTVLGAVVMLGIASRDVDGFRQLSADRWLMLVWLGAVSSAFIYAALATAMQALSATTTAGISTLVTPVSIVIAWATLGERPTVASVVGGVVVVLGVLLVSREPDRATVTERVTVRAD